jgi:hypothetical protein
MLFLMRIGIRDKVKGIRMKREKEKRKGAGSAFSLLAFPLVPSLSF